MSKTLMVRVESSDHSWDVRALSTQQQMVPGGNTGEVKGGEERNWPLYLTMPAAQDKCPSNGHPPQRTESYMGLTFTFTFMMA